MCQRVVIALALACRPQLLIADEPTTGLDVTTQKTVMDLVVELTRERGMSTILITHDLGLAAAYCDRVVVMEKGHVVETATSKTIFTAPSHPYTRKLMRATPRPGVSLRDLLPEDETDGARAAAATPPAKLNGAAQPDAATTASRCWWSTSSSRSTRARTWPAAFAKLLQAQRRGGTGRGQRSSAPSTASASPCIAARASGLVGESGCGKSTTSTMVMRLIDKSDGRIMFDGQDIGAIPAKRFATLPLRKRIQMVFQDPTDSLNPRFTAARAIADPILRLGNVKGGKAVRARCEELARQVGLPIELLDRFPAPALRRPEGARRHRPGDRAQPRAGHPGRADGGARRVGAGGGAQSAAGAQGAARHELSVRLARPQRGAPAVRPGHRHAGRAASSRRGRPSACCSRPRRSTRATCWPRSRIRRCRCQVPGLRQRVTQRLCEAPRLESAVTRLPPHRAQPMTRAEWRMAELTEPILDKLHRRERRGARRCRSSRSGSRRSRPTCR